MIDQATLIGAMAGAGIRVTEPRRRVAGLVARRAGPFTAADLVADSRADGAALGRATAFRAIDLLVSLEVLERIDLPSGEHAYVACRPAHHHHLVCTACGRTTDVEDAGLAEVARAIEERSGYRIDTHRLELYGAGPACREAGVA